MTIKEGKNWDVISSSNQVPVIKKPHKRYICTLLCTSVSLYSFCINVCYSYSADTCKQMSSFGESKASYLSSNQPEEFIRHNTWQLSRTYPSGRRTDSSNYDPVPLWNVGCQLGEFGLSEMLALVLHIR